MNVSDCGAFFQQLPLFPILEREHAELLFIDLDPEASLTESTLVPPRHCGKAMNRTSTAIFSDRARSTSAVISKSASALMLTATDDSEYRCC